MVRNFGERVARNSPIQGSSADIIKIAMINVEKRLAESGLDARLLLQVHDELLIECKKEQAEAALELLKSEMDGAVSLNVPLVVEAHSGKNWLECH
jgi:DNA polymerase-1